MEQRIDIGATISAETLARLAAAGETIVIERAGEEVARFVPSHEAPAPGRKRQLGLARGLIHISDDFDELPEDLLAAFEGEEID